MRKRQIPPPAVHVDHRPQVAHGHGRALDVPARAARPKLRRVPRGLVHRRTPPQGKVEGVPLGARPHLTQQPLVAQLAHHRAPAPMRQSAIRRKPAGVEINRVGLIGESARVQRSHRVQDPGNLGRDVRHQVRPPPPQRLHVGHEPAHLARRQLVPAHTVAARALEQRVVDVGHVLHVGDAHARGLQPAHQHVERAEREGMPKMPRVVGRNAADVERKLSRRARGTRRHRQ